MPLGGYRGTGNTRADHGTHDMAPLQHLLPPAFAISGPSAWNSLPGAVYNLNATESAFRPLLKYLCLHHILAHRANYGVS